MPLVRMTISDAATETMAMCQPRQTSSTIATTASKSPMMPIMRGSDPEVA